MRSCRHLRLGSIVLAGITVASACDRGGTEPSSGTGTSTSTAPAATGAADAAAPTEAAPRFNVVVLTIDSLRADRMPWHGYRHQVVPNLAKLAEGAVRYTRFYSQSSFTSMTFGGFVGARHPSELERSGYFFSSYPDEVLTFPEVLQEAGVTTLAGHAHWYFAAGKANMQQGFSSWELVDGLKKSNVTDENVTSDKLVALAQKQIGSVAPGKPFFAWYHFLDPHDQYLPHPESPSFGGGAQGWYDSEVHFTDMHVGRLVEWIDAQPFGAETAIIVSADHGETFGEHGMYRHGFELWEELIHVPLIVRVPGVAHRVIDEPRSGLDLPRTILELMNVAPDASFGGVSLVPELRGDIEPAPRAVIVDLPRTSDNDRRRALIVGHHKLIAYGDDSSFKLFDLQKDPREQLDLAGKDKALFEKMKKRYEEESARIKSVCPKMRDLKGRQKGKPC